MSKRTFHRFEQYEGFENENIKLLQSQRDALREMLKIVEDNIVEIQSNCDHHYRNANKTSSDMKEQALKVLLRYIDNSKEANDALSELLVLFDVSGSLPSKTYEIDFGGNVKAKIRVCGNELEIEAAMNGWGNPIYGSEISVGELQ